eukprot:TRINITY_DN111_c0_g1_i1.p1 TRINITY_DN111_c0_g1~~TRINITY_DN111_c0_g1_i1.p1  ORF type:complete len:321 (-),score=81.43 TRINITY_DN111_c0_g1_i1:572-1534(-)
MKGIVALVAALLLAVSCGAFRITGLVAAPPTAFYANYSVNYQAVELQVQSLAATGIKYAWILGTTGEGPSLTVPERKLLAQTWRTSAKIHGISLIVHIGSSSVEEGIELAQHAASLNVEAIAALPPWYYKPTDDADLLSVLELYANAAPGVPLYYYHIPSMSNVVIDVFGLFQLAYQSGRIPSLAGVKFSDYDVYTVARIAAFAGEKYNVVFGCDEAVLAGLSMGADGGVGSTYNLPFMVPIYQKLLSSLASGDVAGARDQQLRAVDLVVLFKQYGAGTLKAIMKMVGLDMGPPRLPEQPLTPDQLTQLHADLVRLHFIV